MSNCFGCKESISAVALTSLVYTWEPVGEELQEVGWPKHCFDAQHSVEPTVDGLGDLPAVTNQSEGESPT